MAPLPRHLAERDLSSLDDVPSKPAAWSLATRLAAPTRRQNLVGENLPRISSTPRGLSFGPTRT
jgi:hypothetical protein